MIFQHSLKVPFAYVPVTVMLWNRQAKTLEHIFDHPQGPAWSVGFSPDGQHIASGDSDGKVILWDTKTKQNILH